MRGTSQIVLVNFSRIDILSYFAGINGLIGGSRKSLFKVERNVD